MGWDFRFLPFFIIIQHSPITSAQHHSERHQARRTHTLSLDIKPRKTINSDLLHNMKSKFAVSLFPLGLLIGTILLDVSLGWSSFHSSSHNIAQGQRSHNNKSPKKMTTTT